MTAPPGWEEGIRGSKGLTSSTLLTDKATNFSPFAQQSSPAGLGCPSSLLCKQQHPWGTCFSPTCNADHVLSQPAPGCLQSEDHELLRASGRANAGAPTALGQSLGQDHQKHLGILGSSLEASRGLVFRRASTQRMVKIGPFQSISDRAGIPN